MQSASPAAPGGSAAAAPLCSDAGSCAEQEDGEVLCGEGRAGGHGLC